MGTTFATTSATLPPAPVTAARSTSGQPAPQPAATAATTLTVEDVASLRSAGVSDATIGVVALELGAAQQPAPQTYNPGSVYGQAPAQVPDIPSVSNGDMDAAYPALSSRHVIILRAAGASEAQLMQIAATNPTPLEMEEQLQLALVQPEELDRMLGNPAGTARIGLQTLPPELLANANPNPAPDTTPVVVDRPHADYPGLASSHVEQLRAAGVPEGNLQVLAASNTPPAEVGAYIEKIKANPEGFDLEMGNRVGTARTGLQSIGVLPTAGGTQSWWSRFKVPMLAAGGLGAAFIGARFLKGRGKAVAAAGGGGVGTLGFGSGKLGFGSAKASQPGLLSGKLGFGSAPEGAVGSRFSWARSRRDAGEAAETLTRVPLIEQTVTTNYATFVEPLEYMSASGQGETMKSVLEHAVSRGAQATGVA